MTHGIRFVAWTRASGARPLRRISDKEMKSAGSGLGALAAAPRIQSDSCPARMWCSKACFIHNFWNSSVIHNLSKPNAFIMLSPIHTGDRFFPSLAYSVTTLRLSSPVTSSQYLNTRRSSQLQLPAVTAGGIRASARLQASGQAHPCVRRIVCRRFCTLPGATIAVLVFSGSCLGINSTRRTESISYEPNLEGEGNRCVDVSCKDPCLIESVAP
jgi:hypothetical protein